MVERVWALTLVMVATCCMIFCVHWSMDVADECARDSNAVISLAATSTTIRVNETTTLAVMEGNGSQLVVAGEDLEGGNALLYGLEDDVVGGLVYHDGKLFNVMYRGTALPVGTLRTPVAETGIEWQHVTIGDTVHYWKGAAGPHVWSFVRVVVS